MTITKFSNLIGYKDVLFMPGIQVLQFVACLYLYLLNKNIETCNLQL